MLKLFDAIVGLGFAKSKSEARRLITAGAVKIDSEVVTDEFRNILPEDFAGSDTVLISVGKKKIGRILLTP